MCPSGPGPVTMSLRVRKAEAKPSGRVQSGLQLSCAHASTERHTNIPQEQHNFIDQAKYTFGEEKNISSNSAGGAVHSPWGSGFL